MSRSASISFGTLNDYGTQHNVNGSGVTFSCTEQCNIKNVGCIFNKHIYPPVTLDQTYTVSARLVPVLSSSDIMLDQLNRKIKNFVDKIMNATEEDLRYKMSSRRDDCPLRSLPPRDAKLLVQIGRDEGRPADKIFRAAVFCMTHMALLEYIFQSHHDGSEQGRKGRIIRFKETVSGNVESLFNSIRSRQSWQLVFPDHLKMELQEIAGHALVFQDCLLKEGCRVFLNRAECEFNEDHMESENGVGRRKQVFYTVCLGLLSVDQEAGNKAIIRKQRVMCL